MSEEGFYMTLPSNASPHLYPNNTPACFKVNLPERCDLRGRWQVALLEATYPNTIHNVLEEENWIRLYTEQPVDEGQEQGLAEILEPSRPFLFVEADEVRVPSGLYYTRRRFVKGVLATLDQWTHKTPPLPPEKLSEEEIQVPALFDADLPPWDKGGALYFAPRLASVMGLPHAGPFNTRHSFRNTRDIDLSLGPPNQLFFYMNILEEQIVGHTKAPLLRTVPTDCRGPLGGMSTYHCEYPIYHNIATRSFADVELHIRSAAGDFIPFHHGIASVLCHFRKVSE